MQVKAILNDNCTYIITLDDEARELLHQACTRVNITPVEMIESLVISRLIWLDMLNEPNKPNKHKSIYNRSVCLFYKLQKHFR